MVIRRSSQFKKHYKERIAPNQNLVKDFAESLELFIESPTSSILQDHVLTGSMYGYRAFSITSDIRVVYLPVKEGIVLYDVGTHEQVY